MATVQFASDLHIEYVGLRTIQAEWSKVPGATILVLAGDICSVKLLSPVMDWFCSMYQQVLYVPGNHEYWNTTVAEVAAVLRAQEAKHPNFRVLRNEVLTVDGVTFFGGTLWFARQGPQDSYWIDFERCKDLGTHPYEENRAFRENLVRAKRPIDIVVSHHLPLPQLTAHRFRTGSYRGNNVYFHSDMSLEISTVRPKAWVFGHTHDTMAGLIDGTLFCANPSGYMFESRLGAWSPQAALTVNNGAVSLLGWQGGALPEGAAEGNTHG